MIEIPPGGSQVRRASRVGGTAPPAAGEVAVRPGGTAAAPAERQSAGSGGRSTLLLHALAAALYATGTAVLSILPILARRRFGAGDWQTMFVTAAPPTLLVCSIFWNVLLTRLSVGRYLLVHWGCGVLPLALVALAQSFWHLLGAHLVAAVGAAGWSPVSGHLLERLYPPGRRGRAFGVISAAMLGSGMLTSLGIGVWLERDGESFRWYMPLVAAVQGVGLGLLALLAQGVGGRDPIPAAARTPRRLRDTLAPLRHMRDILRGDRMFLRYEQAFMTYGAGWMICHALLPVLVTTRLGLSYQEIAHSTQVVFGAAMLAMIYPMGWVIDRVGAARSSALSFAGLAGYPLGLLLARGPLEVALASAVYGAAMAGVQHGWMLGPVALAPTPGQVPHYVAIHTTLVGLRAVVGQGLGMALYRLTHSLTWPLLMASAAFAWGAWQMWRLDRTRRDGLRAPLEREIEPPVQPLATGDLS